MARTLRVNIIGDATGINAAFATVGAQAQLMAAKVQSAMAGVSTPALAAAGGIAIAGKQLFDLGGRFDSAYDTIRTGTGATGDDLEALQGSFRDVATRVPADFDSIATAIADLNTRTGLAGQPLEDLGTQFLELSRITGTDIGGNIEAVTEAFGDWEIEDQAGALDTLFRASQMSGAEVSDLAGQVKQFGAPLRQFGFGFEDAVAMMGSFERAGVNTETVMGGLRQGFGRLVAEGEDPKEAFFELARSIEDVGLTAENQERALEIFGSRALSDMSEALDQGRFSFEGFLAGVEGGSETILGAAEDTRSFGESWDLLVNNVLVALEPIATRVFTGMGELMEDLVPVVRDQIIPAVESFASIIEQLWPIVEPFLRQTMRGFELVGETLAVVAAVMKGDWSAAWEGIKEIFDTIWATIWDPITSIGSTVSGAIGDLHGTLIGKGHDLLQGLWDGIAGVWDGTIEPWFTGLPSLAAGFFSEAVGWLADGGKKIADGLWEGITGVWDDTIWPFFENIGTTIAGAFAGAAGWLSGIGRSIASGLWNGFANAINSVSFSISIPSIGMPGPIPDIPGFSTTIDPFPHVPHLARGGVAWDAMLAVIGDNPGPRPEIVTPEDLMRQVFRDELRGGAGQIVHVHVHGVSGPDVMREIRRYVDFEGLAEGITR